MKILRMNIMTPILLILLYGVIFQYSIPYFQSVSKQAIQAYCM